MKENWYGDGPKLAHMLRNAGVEAAPCRDAGRRIWARIKA